jgi:hypothetical protein
MIYIYTIYILMDLSRRHGGKANKAWFYVELEPGVKVRSSCPSTGCLVGKFEHVVSFPQVWDIHFSMCNWPYVTLKPWLWGKKETKPGTTNKPGLKKWNTKENHTFSDVLHQQIPTSSTSRRWNIVFANPKKIENSLPLFTSYFPGVQFFYLFGGYSSIFRSKAIIHGTRNFPEENFDDFPRELHPPLRRSSRGSHLWWPESMSDSMSHVCIPYVNGLV